MTFGRWVSVILSCVAAFVGEAKREQKRGWGVEENEHQKKIAMESNGMKSSAGWMAVLLLFFLLLDLK